MLARRLGALADRLTSAGGGEPPKPGYTLTWPQGVDEFEPQLSHPELPVNLSTIVADLETIRENTSKADADFALGSFVWLAHEGLEVDPIRQSWFLHFFNTRYWPYRSADIRRLADFQNRVYTRFARKHDLLFADIAAEYPQDPAWFIDGVHFSDDGTRLQAWLVMQSLLPRIRERIASGDWPRADQHALNAHPSISPPRAVDTPCKTLGAPE